MIITMTLNPAVDYTILLSQVRIGAVNRFQESLLDPAGKGVNVSRMVHRLGWPTIAFGFIGGEIGLIIEKALDNEGVPHHFTHVANQTRVSVTIRDGSNSETPSYYGPGPPVGGEQLAQLTNLLQFWLQAGRVLVLAGKLPPGVPDDIYADYIRLARVGGVRAVLDADDRALRLGIEAKPFLIKPNVSEAESLLGRSLPNLNAVVEAATELQGRGIEIVVISMGERGAVCVQGEDAWLAVPPKVGRRSTVGSGDSLVAGLAVAVARGENVVEGLRLGTAAGVATAMTPGTAQGMATDIQALLPKVHIEKIR